MNTLQWTGCLPKGCTNEPTWHWCEPTCHCLIKGSCKRSSGILDSIFKWTPDWRMRTKGRTQTKCTNLKRYLRREQGGGLISNFLSGQYLWRTIRMSHAWQQAPAGKPFFDLYFLFYARIIWYTDIYNCTDRDIDSFMFDFNFMHNMQIGGKLIGFWWISFSCRQSCWND